MLDRHRLSGVRFDRDERRLQTEIAGIEWRPEFVDGTLLDRAYAAVSDARRDAAFRAYQKDPRDTATPLGMAALLHSLAHGTLLSPASTRRLLEIMTQTVTFPDRLKAGVPAGWTLAHKTGTSGTWRGVTAATNDVGVLTAPDGRLISVVVFIADSKAPSENRAALMANVARAVVRYVQDRSAGPFRACRVTADLKGPRYDSLAAQARAVAVPAFLDAAALAGQLDAEVAAILELERENRPDEIARIAGGIEVDAAGQRPLARYRKSRLADHALEHAEFVANLPDDSVVLNQVSSARALLDQFHHVQILAFP